MGKIERNLVQLGDEGMMEHTNLCVCECVSLLKLDGKIEMKPSLLHLAMNGI